MVIRTKRSNCVHFVGGTIEAFTLPQRSLWKSGRVVTIGAILHYFPPNPEKIGDNLLTFGIPYEIACSGKQVLYYAAGMVGGIVSRFCVPEIQIRHVGSVEESFRIAFETRRTIADVVDLQQLNCYVDYPESRRWFDPDIPDRAKLDWFDPQATARWGLQPFAEIFRSMLGLSLKEPALPPLFHQAPIVQYDIGLFPHCETDCQQLTGLWADIAALAQRFGLVRLIGRGVLRNMETWPSSVAVDCDLAADELVDRIASLRCAIGGATGLSHLAALLGVPVLMLWGTDHTQVFSPRQGGPLEHVLALELDKPDILERCARFITRFPPNTEGTIGPHARVSA